MSDQLAVRQPSHNTPLARPPTIPVVLIPAELFQNIHSVFFLRNTETDLGKKYQSVQITRVYGIISSPHIHVYGIAAGSIMCKHAAVSACVHTS